MAPSIFGKRSFFVFPFVGVLVFVLACAGDALIGVVDVDGVAFVVVVADGEEDDGEELATLGVVGGLDMEDGEVAKPLPAAISSSLDFLSEGFFRGSTLALVLLNLTAMK